MIERLSGAADRDFKDMIQIGWHYTRDITERRVGVWTSPLDQKWALHRIWTMGPRRSYQHRFDVIELILPWNGTPPPEPWPTSSFFIRGP